MADTRTYNLISIRRCLALGLTIAWFQGMCLANDEASLDIAKTTGPVSGMSVERNPSSKEYRVLWPGHRIVRGTVESVLRGVVKVNTGELLPRFLLSEEALEKGVPPLKKGDEVQLVVNDYNLVADYHLMGQEVWHRIIRGSLVQPLPVGHEWAVIRHEQGMEEAFSVRPLARSKISAIPMNVSAIFLTDETNKIIDASFGNEETLQRRTTEWKKPPPIAPYRQIEGTLVRLPGSIMMGWIMIKTRDGKEQGFEVRPYLQEKFVNIPEGASVILLVDDENKVSDLAKPPS